MAVSGGVIHHLRAAGVSVLLDARGTGVPTIVHWGRDLGPLSDAEAAALADASVPAVPPSSLDQPLRVSLAAGRAEAWTGRPAVGVHRPGAPADLRLTAAVSDGLRFAAGDAALGVAIDTEVELTAQGI